MSAAWTDIHETNPTTQLACRTLDFLKEYAPERYVRAIYIAHQAPMAGRDGFDRLTSP